VPKHNPEKLTTVRIEVTERLIKKGVPNDSVECPIALALKKVVAKNVSMDAGYKELTFESGSFDDYDAQHIATPARASKFMEKMDARDLVSYEGDEDTPVELPPLPKPFSFNLRIRNKFLKPSLRS
jgi:hypothetical protein